MKKYLIVGVSLRSKGGEAMVTEAYKKIREIDPSNLVYLYVPDRDYNARIVRDTPGLFGLQVIGTDSEVRIRNRYLRYGIHVILLSYDFVKALYYYALHREPSKRFFRTSSCTSISNADIIIQIAGISFTDNFGVIHAFSWTWQMILAKMLKKKFFCMPQSFGPSGNVLVRWCAKIGLDQVTYIMPRGKKSAGFIRGLNLKNRNCSFVPDLAFSHGNPLPQDDEILWRRFGISQETRYVGIIFNSHLYRWGGMKMIDILAGEIDRLISVHGYRIILLAHEVDEIRSVDDRYVNTLIFDRCRNKGSILVVNDDLSAKEIKSLVKVCDFTICSRFHGMISSLKVGVIPIVIGWAEKYGEIMELFDAERFVIGYDRVTPENLQELTGQVLRDREELKRRIAIHAAEYEKASGRAGEIIMQYGSA